MNLSLTKNDGFQIENLVTARKAAEIYGCSQRRIYQLIKGKILVGADEVLLVKRSSGESRSESMKRVWQNDEFRQKMNGIRSSDAYRKKASESAKRRWQNGEYRQNNLRGREYPSPNIPENLVATLTPLNVTYTGDGTFWRWLPNGQSTNPDFIVNPVKKTRKVIYHHGTYWHRDEIHNRGQDLIDQWEQLGFKCLIIWEDELQDDLEGILAKIAEFTGEKNWQFSLSMV